MDGINNAWGIKAVLWLGNKSNYFKTIANTWVEGEFYRLNHTQEIWLVCKKLGQFHEVEAKYGSK